MAVALVRTLTGSGAAFGATQTVTLTHDVPIGHALVLAAGTIGGDPAPTGISKPGGESGAWTDLGNIADAAADVTCCLDVIKPSVLWPAGTVITVTFTSNPARRGVILAEFSGVEKIVRGTEGEATSAISYAAATTGPEAVRGDLILGVGAQYAAAFANYIAADTDTVGGAWQTAAALNVRLNGVDPNGLDLTLQYKIATAAGAQTYDVQGKTTGAVSTTNRKVVALAVGLQSSNVAPNAPTLVTMTDGSTIDRARTNRARHAFSDPNPDDSQSAFDHRYRKVGAGSWITSYHETPNEFVDFPPGTFDLDEYERQVLPYDALGVPAGSWSASGFFTAGDPPDGPSITHPIDGATFEQMQLVTWSAPNQDKYRIRRVADDAGEPDESTIYYDSGEVANTVTRSVVVECETNNRDEHIQVQVKFAGLWSEWISVGGEVSFSPPPVPTFLIYPDAGSGSVLVAITNPAPVGDEPSASYNDVYVDDGNGWERRATELSTNTSWRYWRPPSGRDWTASIRVVAVAANGSTSSSGS